MNHSLTLSVRCAAGATAKTTGVVRPAASARPLVLFCVCMAGVETPESSTSSGSLCPALVHQKPLGAVGVGRLPVACLMACLPDPASNAATLCTESSLHVVQCVSVATSNTPKCWARSTMTTPTLAR